MFLSADKENKVIKFEAVCPCLELFVRVAQNTYRCWWRFWVKLHRCVLVLSVTSPKERPYHNDRSASHQRACVLRVGACGVLVCVCTLMGVVCACSCVLGTHLLRHVVFACFVPSSFFRACSTWVRVNRKRCRVWVTLHAPRLTCAHTPSFPKNVNPTACPHHRKWYTHQ